MSGARKKSFIEDANKLSGAEKAAIVLLALGEDHHQLWQSLDADEIKEISQAMSSLGTVTSGVAMPPALSQIAYEGSGEALALPGPDMEATIDIAKIEGQVRASSVKKVSEFVERNPEASISIIRNWLHEAQ